MKFWVLLPLILIALKSQAFICEHLFERTRLDYIKKDEEFLSRIFEDINPDTQGLRFDEEIEPGDYVYVEFLYPLDPLRPRTTKGFRGYILGSRFLRNDENNRSQLYYYILSKQTEDIYRFTENMVDYEYSRFIDREYGTTIH